MYKIEMTFRFVVSHPVYLGSTKWTDGLHATLEPRVWDPCLERCSVRLVSADKEKVACCTWSGRSVSGLLLHVVLITHYRQHRMQNFGKRSFKMPPRAFGHLWLPPTASRQYDSAD